MSDLPPTPTSPPAAPAPPAKSRTLLIVIIIVVAAMIVAIVAIFVLRDDGDDEAVDAGAPGAAQEIQLEPISSATDPFAPAGQIGGDEQITPVQTSGPTSVGGGNVGLYGGTMNKAQCDKDQLTTFLQENPDKGAEWARVLGIAQADIGAYIADLTPLVLRSDTRVTNHGFKDGVATPVQSVLQAGTAVLVDKYGTPVTKCYCGNPLVPPMTPPTAVATTTTAQQTTTTAATTTTTYTPPTYYGPEWPTWNPTSITIIQVNVTIIEIFIVVDPSTGQAFERPRGTSGEADKATDAPIETTTTTTSQPPGSTTTTRPQGTTRPTTTTTMPTTTTTTFPEPTPDCVDEFGNFAPCPGSNGAED